MIYVTGDLHGAVSGLSGAPLSAGDTLLVAGDFGFACRTADEDDIGLAWLAKQPYTILFIDGNHDNLPWLASLPTAHRFGGEVGVVRDNICHLRRGQVYTVEGKTVFALGGAASTDRAFREQSGKLWFAEELPSAAELEKAAAELDRHGWRVDVVLTHTAPREAIYAIGGHPYPPEKPLTAFLDRLVGTLDFSAWYFGHWHTDAVLSDRLIAVYEAIRPFSAD